MDSPAKCRRCAKRVPWASFWGNLILAIYKLIVGILGQSAALIADSIHSFTDVVGSTGILVATRISCREPDESYPYGRGKAEFVGAVFVYTILIFFSVMIMVASIRSMWSHRLGRPHFMTALGALVSVLYNYLMYRYATCAGRRNNSPAILADAFENRADAVSSVACIVGILGALVVDPICDQLAALLVGVIIFYNCIVQLREAAAGLMDSALPEGAVSLIERTAQRHDGVVAVNFVRSRQTGVRYWIDVGIAVSPELSVEQADAIVAAVRADVRSHSNCHFAEIYVVPAGAPDTESVVQRGIPAPRIQEA